MNSDNELLTISQILESCGGKVCRSTLCRWIRVGVKGKKLSAVLIGGKWFVSPDDFLGFLASLQPIPPGNPTLERHAGLELQEAKP